MSRLDPVTRAVYAKRFSANAVWFAEEARTAPRKYVGVLLRASQKMAAKAADFSEPEVVL